MLEEETISSHMNGIRTSTGAVPIGSIAVKGAARKGTRGAFGAPTDITSLKPGRPCSVMDRHSTCAIAEYPESSTLIKPAGCCAHQAWRKKVVETTRIPTTPQWLAFSRNRIPGTRTLPSASLSVLDPDSEAMVTRGDRTLGPAVAH